MQKSARIDYAVEHLKFLCDNTWAVLWLASCTAQDTRYVQSEQAARCMRAVHLLPEAQGMQDRAGKTCVGIVRCHFHGTSATTAFTAGQLGTLRMRSANDAPLHPSVSNRSFLQLLRCTWRRG